MSISISNDVRKLEVSKCSVTRKVHDEYHGRTEAQQWPIMLVAMSATKSCGICSYWAHAFILFAFLSDSAFHGRTGAQQWPSQVTLSQWMGPEWWPCARMVANEHVLQNCYLSFGTHEFIHPHLLSQCPHSMVEQVHNSGLHKSHCHNAGWARIIALGTHELSNIICHLSQMK